MTIPTKPIGSLPRPLALIEAIKVGNSDDRKLNPSGKGGRVPAIAVTAFARNQDREQTIASGF